MRARFYLVILSLVSFLPSVAVGAHYNLGDDFDLDFIVDEFDNCPFTPNYDQADVDGDLWGDVCDRCLFVPDPSQSNIDGDGFGDACDIDPDGDGVVHDNCPLVANAAQVDSDRDGQGDACDPDDDGDLVNDENDNCRLGSDPTTDVCEDDADRDGVLADSDNCPWVANRDQQDLDEDGLGDACDSSSDGDIIPDWLDNCPDKPNDSQLDVDGDGLGDAGRWDFGEESCDPSECYVVPGYECLDPSEPFRVAILDRYEGSERRRTGDVLHLHFMSNRLGHRHEWRVELVQRPDGSDVELEHRTGDGSTTLDSVALSFPADLESCPESHSLVWTPCEDDLGPRVKTDRAGVYKFRVTVTVPDTGETTVSGFEIQIAGPEVEIEGCAGAPGSAALTFLVVAAALKRSRCRGRASGSTKTSRVGEGGGTR